MISYRPLEEKDLKFFNETRNSCRNFLHDNREFTLEQTQAWFRSTPQTVQTYYLVHNDVRPIGYIRTYKYDSTCWQIGMDLAPEFQGAGLAKDIYRKFMSEHPEVDSWCLEVLATNVRAFNLYIDLGFRPNPELGVKLVGRDGRYIPSIYMATDVP